MESFKTMKWNSTINAVIMILLGLLLLIYPEESLNIGGYLIASIFMLAGLGFIIKLVKNNGVETNGDIIFLIDGIAAIALSVTIFLDPTWLIRMLNIVVGIILIISSIMNFLNMIKFKDKSTSWWIYTSLIILVFIIGILIIVNPLFLTKIIVRLAGAFLVINTIITMILTRKLSKLEVVEVKGELVVKN